MVRLILIAALAGLLAILTVPAQQPGEPNANSSDKIVAALQTQRVSYAATKTLLTERLLNVPADTALELLAAQVSMSVVRKGNTFRIMSNGAQ
jgi:hypothetical protein